LTPIAGNRNFRRDVLDGAVRALGIGPFTPHHLRDTAPAWLSALAPPSQAVQRRLGHVSAAMTLDVYSGLPLHGRSGAALRRRRPNCTPDQPHDRPVVTKSCRVADGARTAAGAGVTESLLGQPVHMVGTAAATYRSVVRSWDAGRLILAG
jgi:hypothetical protein